MSLYEEVVCQEVQPVVVELGYFTATELGEALDVHRQTAKTYIALLIEAGIVRDTGERKKHGGPGRPAPVFTQAVISAKTWRAMTAEPKPVVNRERREPPERELARTMPDRHARRGGGARSRKRSRPKVGERAIQDLIDAAIEAGIPVEKTSGQHIRFLTPKGPYIVSGTRAKGRAAANARAGLRARGVPV